MAGCIVTGAYIRWSAGNQPLPIDRWWHAYANLHRDESLVALSTWLNHAGGTVIVGYAVPALVAIGLCLARRYRDAVTIAVASLVTAPLVNVIKAVLRRPRPDDGMIAVELAAYPSGHVANLTVLLVVAGLLVRKWWIWPPAAALVLAMAFSRTYLNLHWLTDTVGGAMFGAGVGMASFAMIRRKGAP